MSLLLLYSFLFEKRFRYRRLRLKHKITDKHKAERLAWCFNNRNTDFANYVFVDKTLYHRMNFHYYIKLLHKYLESVFGLNKNLSFYK